MEEKRNYSRFQRLMALLLTVVMTVGYIPVSGSADASPYITTRSDPATLSRPEEIYGTNTKNAGKVTVGKSVSATDDGLEAIHPGLTLTDANHFMVTMSQTAQVAGLTSKTSVPVDVVFVLDTSGSMEDNDRAETMVTAANTAISTLMSANEQNRVAVVAFSSKGYGEGSSGDAAANVLSDLKHYTGEEATEHLRWVTSENKINRYGTHDHISGRNASGYRLGKKGGTNIQSGIALGSQILMDVQDTTWTNQETGQTVTRIPFVILLSDGQPTFTYNTPNWYNPASSSDEQGPGSASYEGNGFLAALTAAYYKGKITEKYYGSNADSNNRCYFYTIGVQISNLTGDDKRLAQITLDPATYTTGTYAEQNAASYWNYGNTVNDTNKYTSYGWKSYWNNFNAANPSDFSIRVNTYYYNYRQYDTEYTVTRDSILATRDYVNGFGYTGGIGYNDDYYDASQVSQLGDIFSSLVATINEKSLSAPTKVTAAPHFSGYVTFTDPIGEFMDVKHVKGLYANHSLYTGERAAQYLNGENPDNGSAAFFQTLREILKARLEMTGTQNVNTVINNIISDRTGSTAIRDNSVTWWGRKIASSDESHVQCLGSAEVTNSNMTEFLKTATVPEINGIMPDTLCRTYLFYGASEAGQSNHDYMYLIVRVQQEVTAPYRQTVVVSIPSTLLSVDQIMITDNNDHALAKIVSDDEPLRVVYEVGLRDDINPQNVKTVVDSEMPGYASETGNMVDGKYQFYTNDWDREADEDSHHRAMTKATFEAALDNPFYAYQEDTPILQKNGDRYTPYTGSSQPTGTMYYAREYYDWTGVQANADGTFNAEKRTAYIPINLTGSEPEVTSSSNGWYVRKGSYTAHSLSVDNEEVLKDDKNHDPIGSVIVAHPHKTESGNDSHYTVLLGNNGLLTTPYIETKSVFKTDAQGTKIEANGKAVTIDEVLTYEVRVFNDKDEAANAVVTDYIPEGTVYVPDSASHDGVLKTDAGGKQYLEWKLSELDAGSTTTVSFQVKVTEDAVRKAIPSINNQASVSIGNDVHYQTNITKNPPEGKIADATNQAGGALKPEDILKVGDQLTYTIRYINDSNDTAEVKITDVIPAGTSFVSATDNGSYSQETNTVTWTMANTPAGSGGSVSFVVRVNASARENKDGEVLFENNAGIKIGTNDPRQTNKVINKGGVGSIALTKIAQGTHIPDDTFTLILTSSDTTLNGDYPVTGSSVEDSVTFTNGTGRLKLKAGDTAVVQKLALGTPFTVVEDTTDLPYWEDSYNKEFLVVSETTGTADIEVTNTFLTIPVTFQLSAVKKFIGTFPEGSYTFAFQAQQCEENGDLIPNGRVANATATRGTDNSDVPFTFSARNFDAPIELFYRISEIAPLDPNIRGDRTEYLMKLKVAYEEDASGNNTNKLIATTWYKVFGQDGTWQKFDWTDPAASPITFTNNYPRKTFTLEGTKTLTGRNISGAEFSFQLLDSTGAVIGTATLPSDTNSPSASFSFSLNYGAADIGKTYTYTVKEITSNSETSKIVYDESVYTVTVAVGIDGNGQLTVSPTYKIGEAEKSGITFSNIYNNGVDLTLTGRKIFHNYTSEPDPVFSFEVVDSTGKVVSTAAITGGGDLTFSNIHYTLAEMGNDTEKIYTYTVREIIPGELTADPNMIYDERTYKAQVKVTRDPDTGIMTASLLDIDPNVDPSNDAYHGINFVNFKNPALLKKTLTANKITEGALVPPGLSFSFELMGVTVDKLTGDITPGKLEATGTSDPTTGGKSTTTTETVMVDSGETDADGNPVQVAQETSVTTLHSETSEVTFTELVFTREHANKTFHYIMEESNSGSLNGVTYDTTKYLVSLRVFYDENGKLTVSEPEYKVLIDGEAGTNTSHFTDATAVTFRNEYNAEAHLNLTASKALTGSRPLGNNEFDFALERLDDTDTHVVTGSRVTGTNHGTSVSFATLNFSTDMLTAEYTPESDGSYLVSYKMYEIIPEGARIPGVTYDDTDYIVTVKLVLDGTDLIPSLYSVNGNPVNSSENTGVTFRNHYTVETGTDATIVGKKTLHGRNQEAGEFDFVLYRLDEQNGTVTEKRVAAVQNDADGNFSFTRSYNANHLAEAAFDINNKFNVTYHIKEEGVMPAGVTRVSGEFWVKVEIFHNTNASSYEVTSVKYYSDAGCTQEVTRAEFVNQYRAESVSAAPVVTKQLLKWNGDGQLPTELPQEEGQFSFQIFSVEQNDAGEFVETTNVVSTGISHADGSVTFSDIPFTSVGHKYFVIREVPGADNSVRYADEAIYWHVQVTDNTETGMLETTGTYYSDLFQTPAADTVFENYQGNGKVDVGISLKKVVEIHNSQHQKVGTYTLTGGEYDFGIYKTGTDILVGGGTNQAGDPAAIIFDNLTITMADFLAQNSKDNDGNALSTTFRYTVREFPTGEDGPAAAITDPNGITVTVTVTHDGYRNLSATVDYDKDPKVSDEADDTFVNQFHYTQSDPLNLRGTKILEGKTLNDKEFTFQISGGNLDSPMTAKNGTDGSFEFANLPAFIQPGVFTYTVEEIPTETTSTNGTYSFDPTKFTVEVTVTPDIDGKLHAVPMYYIQDAATGEKITVGGITFTNRYTPKPVSLDLKQYATIQKVIVDETGKPLQLPADGFKFELVGILDQQGNTITATSTNGVIEFPAITFTTAANYTFYIVESDNQSIPGYEKDHSAWMVDVTVTYNAETGALEIPEGNVQIVPAARSAEGLAETGAELQNIVFSNIYKPEKCEAVIELTKSLTGRPLRGGEFTFRLMQGNLIIAETTNTGDGKVIFHVPYTGADMSGAQNGAKDFPYTVVEVAGPDNIGITYDTAPRYVTVTVTDTDGKLSAAVNYGANTEFKNSYQPRSVTVEIKAKKHMEGRLLSDNDFIFQLTGDPNGPIDGKNLADGTIVFNRQPILDKVGTYTYELREVPPNNRAAGEITYDSRVITVTVNVTDDLNGQLVANVEYSDTPTFHNIYEGVADDAKIEATKVLDTESNRTLKAGEFTFQLVDASGNVLESVTNDAQGKVHFSALWFNTVGEYHYTVREVKGDETGGMDYDETVHNVTVKVDTDDNGDFETSIIYGTDDGKCPTFTNKFTPVPVSATLEAKKILENRNLKDKEFKFELLNKKDGSLIESVWNDAQGNITFSPLHYKEAGSHQYIIREIKGSEKRMSYDETEYTVTVTVTDTDGILTAVVDRSGDNKPVFRNTYDSKPISVELSAKKTLETDSLRLLKAKEFSFELLNEAGEVLQTRTNTIFGNVHFDAIEYDAVGTHTYTIREVPGNESGMTYDKTEYKVKVTVTHDPVSGDYVAKVSYETEDGKAPVFVNKFKPLSVKVNLTGTKKLSGRNLRDKEFRFTVYDSDGKKVTSGYNNTAGKITFDPITFSKPGVYNYTVKENIGLSLYVQYDRKAKDVTVTVTDTDGVLTAVVTYPEDGIAFRNRYDPSGDILPQTGEQLPLIALLATALLSAAGLVVMFFIWLRNKKRTA